MKTILEPLYTNKYIIKNLFNFATGSADQDFSNLMVSIAIDSLPINIYLKYTKTVCNNKLSKCNGIIYGLKKS